MKKDQEIDGHTEGKAENIKGKVNISRVTVFNKELSCQGSIYLRFNIT